MLNNEQSSRSSLELGESGANSGYSLNNLELSRKAPITFSRLRNTVNEISKSSIEKVEKAKNSLFDIESLSGTWSYVVGAGVLLGASLLTSSSVATDMILGTQLFGSLRDLGYVAAISTIALVGTFFIATNTDSFPNIDGERFDLKESLRRLGNQALAYGEKNLKTLGRGTLYLGKAGGALILNHYRNWLNPVAQDSKTVIKNLTSARTRLERAEFVEISEERRLNYISGQDRSSKTLLGHMMYTRQSLKVDEVKERRSKIEDVKSYKKIAPVPDSHKYVVTTALKEVMFASIGNESKAYESFKRYLSLAHDNAYSIDGWDFNSLVKELENFLVGFSDTNFRDAGTHALKRAFSESKIKNTLTIDEKLIVPAGINEFFVKHITLDAINAPCGENGKNPLVNKVTALLMFSKADKREDILNYLIVKAKLSGLSQEDFGAFIKHLGAATVGSSKLEGKFDAFFNKIVEREIASSSLKKDFRK